MRANIHHNSQAGCSGQFQFIQIDASKVKGTGPGGQVTPEDLFLMKPEKSGVLDFSRDQNGRIQPKEKSLVKVNKIVKNKFTKRGLGRLMHEALIGHTGGPFAPSEIVSPTINPFLAFVMFSDQTSPARVGDKRVEWDESDTANVADLPATTATIAEGRRGLLLSDTAGTLRRLTISYIGTNPYGVIEYVFFAQSNNPAINTGALGIDGFPIKGIALAEELDDAGTGTKLGVRAVVGLTPTLQGKSDRVYRHEGQQQSEDLIPNEYTGTTVAGVAGYMQSSKFLELQIGTTSTPSAGDSITAATRTIVIDDAATILPSTSGFSGASHVRKVLRISGSATAANDRDYTIQEVLSSTSVKVFESPTADDTNNFDGGVYTVYHAHNLFDGRVENEGRVESSDTATVPVPTDQTGAVVHGEAWSSVDTSGPHTAGRVFASDKTIAGVRIVIPAGVNKDFVPDSFKIQLLDPGANGGSPRPAQDADYIDATATLSSQADAIFEAGVYGVEYTFTPTSCRGVRIKDAVAFSSTRGVKVAAFMCYEEMVAQALSANTLELKVKSGDSFKTFTLPDVSSTQDVNDFVTSLNTVLRGYQMEAVRSTFGFLWLRGTVAGDNSQLLIDAEAGQDANTELGFPSGATTKTGITQAITKAASDALIIIYRVQITGDVPGGFA